MVQFLYGEDGMDAVRIEEQVGSAGMRPVTYCLLVFFGSLIAISSIPQNVDGDSAASLQWCVIAPEACSTQD